MPTNSIDRLEVAGSSDGIAPCEIRCRAVPDPAGCEDSRLVESRAVAFARELGAAGELGRLLARRAATLSVRMDQSAERELLAVAALADGARRAFDADRQAERDGWAADLRGSDRRAIAGALDGLSNSPEGLDHLINAWGGLLAAIRVGDAAGSAARDRAALWLAARGEEGAPGDLAARVDAEVADLRERAGRAGAALARAIAQARHDAGVAATFDASPEAKQARRHEAAAERGFFRALRMIRSLRQDADSAAVESARVEVRAPLLGRDDRPKSPSASPPPPPRPAVPLGSFFPDATVDLPIGLGRPATAADPARKARPDLRKLAGGRR